MSYYGNEPAKVALKVGSGVITAEEIQDASISTADIANDAITPNQLDDDGTGFQVGTLGIGAAVSGGHALLVSGTSSISGNATFAGKITTSAGTNLLDAGTGNTHAVQVSSSASSYTSNIFYITKYAQGASADYNYMRVYNATTEVTPFILKGDNSATFAGSITQTSASDIDFIMDGTGSNHIDFAVRNGAGNNRLDFCTDKSFSSGSRFLTVDDSQDSTFYGSATISPSTGQAILNLTSGNNTGTYLGFERYGSDGNYYYFETGNGSRDDLTLRVGSTVHTKFNTDLSTTFSGTVTAPSLISTAKIISGDNMFIGGGQFYLGGSGDSSSTHDTWRMYGTSGGGDFIFQQNVSGTWTSKLVINASNSSATFAGNVRSNTLLETNSGSNGNEVIPLKIRNNAGGGWGAGTAVSMEFVQGDGGGDAAGAKIKCDRTVAYNGGSDNDAKLEFYTSNADAYVKALTIDSNQNIQMVGVVDAPYLRVGDTGGLPQYSGRFQVDGGAWFFKSNIEVGIGKDGSNYTLIGWNDSGDYGRVKTGNNEELKIQDGGGSTTFGGTITNAPSTDGAYAMFVNQQHATGWGLRIAGGADSSDNLINAQNGSGTEKFVVKSDGSATFAGTVSIGSAASRGQLHVDKGVGGANSIGLVVNNTYGTANTEISIDLECGSQEVGRISAVNTGSDIGDMKFWTASSASNLAVALTINSSQNATFAGAITTYPNVEGDGQLVINNNTYGNGSGTETASLTLRLGRYNDGGSHKAGIVRAVKEGNWTGSYTKSSLEFWTNKDETEVKCLTLNSEQKATFTGLVQVGAISSGNKFTIAGYNGRGVTWYSTAADRQFYFGLSTSAANYIAAKGIGGGNMYFGVGVSPAQYTLDVAGNIGYSGSITDYSLRSTKKDIVEIDGGGMIEKVKKLPLYKYNLKTEPMALKAEDEVYKRSKGRYGLIADDEVNLEEFPELINWGQHEDEDEPRIVGIDTTAYIGVLHGAIKELISKVEALENA